MIPLYAALECKPMLTCCAASIIVPLKTLQELQRILSGIKDSFEDNEQISIFVSDNQILFVYNNIFYNVYFDIQNFELTNRILYY